MEIFNLQPQALPIRVTERFYELQVRGLNLTSCIPWHIEISEAVLICTNQRASLEQTE